MNFVGYRYYLNKIDKLSHLNYNLAIRRKYPPIHSIPSPLIDNLFSSYTFTFEK